MKRGRVTYLPKGRDPRKFPVSIQEISGCLNLNAEFPISECISDPLKKSCLEVSNRGIFPENWFY